MIAAGKNEKNLGIKYVHRGLMINAWLLLITFELQFFLKWTFLK